MADRGCSGGVVADPASRSKRYAYRCGALPLAAYRIARGTNLEAASLAGAAAGRKPIRHVPARDRSGGSSSAGTRAPSASLCLAARRNLSIALEDGGFRLPAKLAARLEQQGAGCEVLLHLPAALCPVKSRALLQERPSSCEGGSGVDRCVAATAAPRAGGGASLVAG